MMNKLKNKFLIALIFGLYQMLICLFFGTYGFLDSSVNLGVYLGVIFSFITVIKLVTLFVISKTKYSKAKQSIFFSISFMISAVIGGSLSYFIIASNFQNYLIYIASFLISAFLPTVFFLLKFIYDDAANRISDLKKVSLRDSSTQLNEEPVKLFHLENENGKLLLEVPVDKIICYEANDNYVVTYYLDKQNYVKRSMERVSLKRIEELLTLENVSFLRVHKSYLINPDYLEEIKGKAQAYKIKLRDFDILVPVSRSYDISSLEKRMF